MKRVVIAPDKFKGSLTAAEAAAAMRRGVLSVAGDAEVVVLPMSDGGEGFTEALLASLGGSRRDVEVTGPDGETVTAFFGDLPDGRGVLETATASGLQLMGGSKDPLGATSFGTGELITAAHASVGSKTILCGLGGSAYNDGGTGAAAAIGWIFLDAAGRQLDRGVEPLLDLVRIERGEGVERLVGLDLVGAYDVDNPLLGPRGAAAVFGPQKGASPDQVELISRAHEILASRIEADLDIDVAGATAAGASGGLGAGLLAFFGASLRPGFDLVAESAGLADQIDRADLVLTGEGSLDISSLGGKTPAGVGRLADAAGVDCLAIAGVVDVSAEDLSSIGITDSVSLVDYAGERAALDDPARWLAAATASALS